MKVEIGEFTVKLNRQALSSSEKSYLTIQGRKLLKKTYDVKLWPSYTPAYTNVPTYVNIHIYMDTHTHIYTHTVSYVLDKFFITELHPQC